MHSGLATTTMIGSLLVGAWCFVAVARNRWIDRTHAVLLLLIELLVLIQAVVVVVRLVTGDRPVEFATFIGYLLVSLIMLPLAVGLALMERTRWGAVIAGSGAVVVAVLTLRLVQVWTPLR